ncbi:MAG: serine/threonine-protein kinase [Planctomycetota bacterium]
MAIELVPEMFLGDYQLIEQAGAGGFSVVWKARRAPQDEEDVPAGEGQPAKPALFALKVPQVESFIEHLRAEADLSAALRDPQVVPVLAAHLDHDPPFLVMPWVEGRDLAPPEQVEPHQILDGLDLAQDLARVLARLHAAGAAHGDVKPSNIRLDREGRVRLLDLGLGRLQVEANLERSLAQSLVSVDGRSIAGTLDYMAPELFEGQRPGPATDAYALGVLLHHLLTGRPPAFGVSPRELNPYLPPGTEDLLRGLLHHDPAARPALRVATASLARLAQAERRCLARPNGHERRAVFQRRLGVLQRGLRALLVGLSLPTLVFAARFLTLALGSLQPVDLDPLLALLIPVVSASLCLGTLLGVTTINAWLVGVPDGVYKKRPGHPLWSFMMQ